MRYILVIVCLLITLNSNGQEKRLAWVIGNSNYEKGFLKNPVNDALLVAKTLKELNFTVLLDTNIATEKDFNDAVRKFGEQRSNFNIGFIYYAGHGIQIKDVNYLLPTKEDYLDEYDVEDKALSVQKIMRYIEDRSSEVNVLILDACRDNPFEKTWKATGRSLEGSRGLAKANPPTGSLIAYSTDAGNIAADGSGKNSIYCLSLIKNMQIENLTLDQVFRNVRTEVLKLSENKQRPVEASQLTGEAFYLKRGTYLEQINVIDSLIKKENYTLALQEVSSILTHDATNKMALCRKGEVLTNLQGENYDGTDLFKAIKLYPKDAEPLVYLGLYYYSIDKKDEALSEYGKAIKLDSTYTKAYFQRTTIYEESNQLDKALMDYNKTIELEPKNDEYYFYRAVFYQEYKEDYQNALIDFSKAIELNPKEVVFWYERGRLYYRGLNNNKKALEDYNKVLELDSTDIDAYNSIGLIYKNQGELEKAIEAYKKGISLEKTNPTSASYCYRNRASIYEKQNLLDTALEDYNKAIELDPSNVDRYSDRANFYQNYKQDYQNALIDFSKAIELSPNDKKNWYSRGILFDDYLNNNTKALEDYNKVLELDSTDGDAINAIGLIHKDEGQLDKAIETFERGISLEKYNPNAAAFCYQSRATIYEKKQLLEKALADYNKAISLDSTNAKRYADRADYYLNFKADYTKALLDFTKAIKLNSQGLYFWFRRGYLYKNYLNNDEKALEDFNEVLELDSSNIDAINWIGVIYQNKNELEKAIEIFNKGISLEKSNPASASYCYRNRASIYEEQNLLDKALEDYNKSIALDPTNADRYLDRAAFCRDYKKDYQNALIDFSKAIELNPIDKNIWYLLGRLYQDNLSNNKKALEVYNKVLELDSSNVEAINTIGVIYQEEGQFDKAIEIYNRGINLEKNNPSTAAYCHRNRASIYEKQNLLDKALEDYNKAIELDPTNAERFSDRAIYYRDYKKENQMALIDFTKAIELDPNETINWYRRGGLYDDILNNNKKALEDYNKILELDSTNIDAINATGLIYQEEGQLEKAIETYNRGILLEKANPSAASYCYRNRASINEKQNLSDKALEDYNKAIELDPNNAYRYSDRADFYKNYKKDYQNALIDYSMAIKLNSKDVSNWYARGKFYYENLYDNKKALEDFNKVLELDSTDGDAINAIGVIYQSENLLEKAIETYNRGIQLEKANPSATAYCYRNRASIYEKQNLLDKALEDFNKAILLDSTNADSYLDRAKFYQDYKEDYQNALIDFSKAIELNPNDNSLWYSRGFLFDDYLNNNKKALEDYNKILEIDSTYADAINAIGLIYQEEVELEKAIETYNRGILLEKANPSSSAYCLRNRASIYEKQNLLDKALADYNRAIELDPANADRYSDRADFYNEKMNLLFEAFRDYCLAINIDSSNSYAWQSRAIFYSGKLNQQSLAIDNINYVLELDSNDLVALNWKGVFYYRMGDYKKADSCFREIIKYGKQKKLKKSDNEVLGWSYSNLGDVFKIYGNYDSTMFYYNNAIKADSLTPIRHYCLGMLEAIYMNSNKSALKNIDQAILLDDKNPHWLYYKSKICFYNLNEKETFNTINKAIELSDNKSIYLAERGNYYRAFKKYDLAQKDFNEAMKLDSNLAATYHYQILLLKDKSQVQEAIKFGEKTIAKFKNDTVSNYLLGEIYSEQKDYLKSLKYYSTALAIMEYDSIYQIEEEEIKMVYLSNTFQKVGEVYQLLGDKELPKEYYAKALIALKDEIRPDKLLKEKELQDLLKQ